MKSSRHRGRRRTSKHRGFAGIAIRSAALLVLLGTCIAAVRWFTDASPKAVEFTNSTSNRALGHAGLAAQQASGIQSRNRRLVYPYSVVPGGVSSPEELHHAVDHDATVADHYHGFDYARARVIEVKEPRLVYLSYRRGNRVFWTHKQASLHKGEKLITDGKMTARSRCGNQVSVLPQANTAPDEPLIAELDRPDAVASGMQQFPGNFDSSLLSLDPAVPGAPTGLGGPGGGLFGGGGPGNTFIPLPTGPGVPISNGCVPKPSKPCSQQPPPPQPPPPPPPAVPEPGTVLLFASGAAAVFARWRSRR